MRKIMCNRSEVVTNGCSGACCENFGLPYTHEEFQEMVRRHKSGEATFVDRKGVLKTIPLKHEIEYITDMLIPLAYSNISAESEFEGQTIVQKFKSLYPDHEPYDGAMNGCDLKDGELYGYYFTCKHFDTKDRICTAYENRPYLCKSFGINFQCGYKGCGINTTMEKLREVPYALSWISKNFLHY
jgi:Fe-S-cluster containining protein